MGAREHNAGVWETPPPDLEQWSTVVTVDEVAVARKGRWQVQLTPTKPVPADWFPELQGLDILGLASGGGQQSPLFAAAGASVTTIDISERQLELDRFVASRDGLQITTVQGDMADLSIFDDESFDLVFHPSANSYVDDVHRVWAESFRVLRPGGLLLAGFNNPAVYMFDWKDHERGILRVRHRLPFSDERDLTPEERQACIDEGVALEHSHTLADQIGGQLDVGFELIGFYEDRQQRLVLAECMPTSIATRARKPAPTRP